MKRPSALTITSKGGLLRAILSDCHICPAFDPNVVPQHQHPPYETFKAIWDTGATGSVITQEVVNKCGLKPTGMKQVSTANGVYVAETFVVNIRLPNGVLFMNVPVTSADLSSGMHALIGMDIITIGDFSITNYGGKTVMSFRTPSQKTVDYVQEINRHNAAAAFKPGPPRKGKHR